MTSFSLFLSIPSSGGKWMEIENRNITSFFPTYYSVLYIQACVFRIPLHWKCFGNEGEYTDTLSMEMGITKMK